MTEPNPNPQEPDPQDPPAITQEDLDKAVAAANEKSSEQMKQMERDNQKNTNELIANMNQQRFNQQEPPAEAPGVSSEAFAKAIEEGEPGTVAKYMKEQLDAKDKQWEQKFNQLQVNGMNAIGDLSKQQASKDLPFYNDYKEQIEALLTKHNANDPQSIQNAYDLVIGQNMTEVLKKEMEKKARQVDDEGTITPGANNQGRNMNPAEGPFDADAVLSPEAKKALSMRHDPLSPDQYTQKINRNMGTKFENFESMHKKRDELIKEDKEFQW